MFQRRQDRMRAATLDSKTKLRNFLLRRQLSNLFRLMSSVSRVVPSASGVRNVFPTVSSFICFVAYIGFFVLHGLLVTASRRGTSGYDYDPAVVVLLSEALKLFCSLGLFAVEVNSAERILSELWRARRVFFRYVVPAALYCLYNNLAFINLANFDPTTYSLLLQLRIVVVGVAFQLFFQRRLSRVQWLSLGILTLGCLIKECGKSYFPSQDSSDASNLFDWKIFLILIQVMCSSVAGVYNEFLLKDSAAEAPLMVQNVFMYSNSILCNAGLLVFGGGLERLASPAPWTSVLADPLAAPIVVNSAAMGLVTSFFLKNLNSILKVHASGLELSLLAVFSFLLFGIPVDSYTVLSIALISVSSYCMPNILCRISRPSPSRRAFVDFHFRRNLQLTPS